MSITIRSGRRSSSRVRCPRSGRRVQAAWAVKRRRAAVAATPRPALGERASARRAEGEDDALQAAVAHEVGEGAGCDGRTDGDRDGPVTREQREDEGAEASDGDPAGNGRGWLGGHAGLLDAGVGDGVNVPPDRAFDHPPMGWDRQHPPRLRRSPRGRDRHRASGAPADAQGGPAGVRGLPARPGCGALPDVGHGLLDGRRRGHARDAADPRVRPGGRPVGPARRGRSGRRDRSRRLRGTGAHDAAGHGGGRRHLRHRQPGAGAGDRGDCAPSSTACSTTTACIACSRRPTTATTRCTACSSGSASAARGASSTRTGARGSG